MGLLTSKAKIIITFNRNYTTLSSVELNLDSDSYAIGRASNEIELGSGDEKLTRKRIYDEVIKNPNQVMSILNRYPELKGIPAVYVTAHQVHGKKIVFAPYLTNISRDIGFLTFDRSEYQFTSNGPSIGIFSRNVDLREVKKGQKMYLHYCNTLEDGDDIFKIIFYY